MSSSSHSIRVCRSGEASRTLRGSGTLAILGQPAFISSTTFSAIAVTSGSSFSGGVGGRFPAVSLAGSPKRPELRRRVEGLGAVEVFAVRVPEGGVADEVGGFVVEPRVVEAELLFQVQQLAGVPFGEVVDRPHLLGEQQDAAVGVEDFGLPVRLFERRAEGDRAVVFSGRCGSCRRGRAARCPRTPARRASRRGRWASRRGTPPPPAARPAARVRRRRRKPWHAAGGSGRTPSRPPGSSSRSGAAGFRWSASAGHKFGSRRGRRRRCLRAS